MSEIILEFRENICKGKIMSTKRFLDHGLIDVNEVLNPNGNRAIHYACFKPHPRILKILLEANADPNAKGWRGGRPLHFAASAKRGLWTECANLLLKANADVHAMDDSGMQPLHYSVKHDHTQVFQLLIQHNADINAKTKFDESCLDIAMYCRNKGLIRSLVEWGCYIELHNIICIDDLLDLACDNSDSWEKLPYKTSFSHKQTEYVDRIIRMNFRCHDALLEALEKMKVKLPKNVIEKVLVPFCFFRRCRNCFNFHNQKQGKCWTPIELLDKWKNYVLAQPSFDDLIG